MFAPPYGDEVNKNTCGAAGASREKSCGKEAGASD
jgi:hypothetical protein